VFGKKIEKPLFLGKEGAKPTHQHGYVQTSEKAA